MLNVLRFTNLLFHETGICAMAGGEFIYHLTHLWTK